MRILQLRSKTLPDGAFLAIALRLRDLTRRAGAVLIVNDRLDVALAAGADGVHVGQEDLPLAWVRRLAGPKLLVGQSTHRLREVVAAARSRASYLGFGPVFSAATKGTGEAVVGLAALRRAARAVRLPVVAIGGVRRENLPLVRSAGARGAAVLSAIVAAPRPEAAARELVRLWSESGA